MSGRTIAKLMRRQARPPAKGKSSRSRSKQGLAWPTLPGVFAPTSYSLPEGIPLKEWRSIGETLTRVQGSVLWWIGDWLNYGERCYGETYTEAIEATGYDYQTLANAKSLAVEFKFSRRRENLTWNHHVEVQALEPSEQDRVLDEAEGDGKPLSIRDTRKLVRLAKASRAAFKAAEFPTGKYRVFYADPPWSYGNELTGYGTTPEDHYPTMALEDICALPVREAAEDNAVLFLWTTSPLLRETFQVIEAWGFEYKTSFVWDKVKHNMGHYNSVRHEFLLVCTRGACTPDVLRMHDSVVTEERTSHSRKPTLFYEIIEEIYPFGRRVELFQRGTPREGWEVYGNQANAGA